MSEIRITTVGVDKASSIFTKMRQNWLALTASFAAVAVPLSKAINITKEFETAWVDLGKVTNESLDSIKTKIMALPPEIGSATEMMEGYYQVISAGVTDSVQALDTLTVASKAAKASHTAQSEVIKGLTKLMAGYEGEIKNVVDASDLLFAIEKEGQTTFQEIIPLIGGLAKISNELSVSQYEMAASFATITQTAGSSALAATQYRSLMVGLMKPTEDLSKTIRSMGYSTVQTAIEQEGFIGVLKKLKESTGGSAEKMAELLGRQEALLGMSALSANNFETLNQKIESIQQSTGATDKAFEDWEKTLDGLWDTMKNKVGKAMIEIGIKLTPLIKSGLEGVTTAVVTLNGSLNDLSLMAGSIAAGLTAMGIAQLPALFTAASTAVAGLSAGITATFAGLGAGLALTAPQIALLAAAAYVVYDAARKAGEGIDVLVYKLTGIDLSGMNKPLELLKNTLKETSLAQDELNKKVAGLGLEGITSIEQFNAAVKSGSVVFDEVTRNWVEAEQEKINATNQATAEYMKHYKALQSLHANAIEQMKAKSLELLQVEQDIRNARMTTEDLILSVRQKSMGAFEKYNSTIQNLQKKQEIAEKLSGNEKIRMLESIQQQWANTSGAVMDNREVVISASSTEYTALKAIAEIGTAITAIQEKKKTSIKDEIGIWKEVESKALAALETIKTKITDLPDETKLDMDASQALEEVDKITAAINAIPNKVAVIVEAKLKASPERPFSEGIEYMKGKLDSLKTNAGFVFDFSNFSSMISTYSNLQNKTMDRIQSLAPAWDTRDYQNRVQPAVALIRSESYAARNFMETYFDFMTELIRSLGKKLKSEGPESVLNLGIKDSFATGTPYVPETGPYLLHKGEAVIPANKNTYNNSSKQVNKFYITNSDPRAAAKEVAKILKQLGRYDRI